MRRIERMFLAGISAASQCGESTGIFSLIRLYRRKSITILMYHGITAKHHPVANFDGKHVEKATFEKQLLHLKNKYNIISLSDLADRAKKLPKNAMVLTFDDGYANLYTLLYPILKKEKIPVTIFLPTGYIGKKQIGWYDKIAYAISMTAEKKIVVSGKEYPLEAEKQKRAAILELKIKAADNPEKREQLIEEVFLATHAPKKTNAEDFCYLSWKQCKEMQKAGVVFGSHSVTHPFMAKERKTQEKELSQSKKIIEQMLGIECAAFAYPFGDYDHSVAEKTEAQGYRLAVTTKYGSNKQTTNPLMLRRIAVSNIYSAKIFPLLLLFNFGKFHHSIVVAYSKLRKLFL